MMRIYPYAFRVTSSNLDPAFYWRRGAQLVALNWQNLDKGMMLNHGMFVGTHGWRLKPSGYRSSETSTNVIPRSNMTLSIEVYAAQDLSLPQGDNNEKGFKPYVNCQLHVEEPEGDVAPDQDDASSDTEKSSYKRCTKSSSGINPDFHGQKLDFPTVTGIVEELSFLRSVQFQFFLLPLPTLQYMHTEHIRYQSDIKHCTSCVMPVCRILFKLSARPLSRVPVTYHITSHRPSSCMQG
jgi:hypothetical protein